MNHLKKKIKNHISLELKATDAVLKENGYRLEHWNNKPSHNLFKTFSLSLHFSSMEEEKYREKNITYVKNLEPEMFKGKLALLNCERNFLDYLKSPGNPKFEKVKLRFFI